MKIQIVKTFEPDGDWIKVIINGINATCQKVSGKTPERVAEIEAEIQEAYELAVKNATEKRESIIVKETEI